LQNQRTFALGKVAKETGSAEFFLMFSKGGSDTMVEDVKFVNGDESLKSLSAELRNAKYGFNFPDDTPTKIFRRGIVHCSKATSDCNFVMILPEDVRSVD
jgi:hypothetical protein